MKHWIKWASFIAGVGFVGGATAYSSFELFEYLVHRPVGSIDMAIAAGLAGAISAWNA